MSRRAPELSAEAAPAPSTPTAPSDNKRFEALGHLPELVYALAAIVAVTALYGVAYSQASAFPKASSLVGHGIGIAGFILMLMTATLYSLRKLRTDASWGSTAAWLKFHMVTGLVGPYMVLLHTAMKFNGLAGLAMLLTVVVVISGLVGRYLYTRVPRTVVRRQRPAGARARDEFERRLAKRRKSAGRLAHVPRSAHLGPLHRRPHPRGGGALLRDAAAIVRAGDAIDEQSDPNFFSPTGIALAVVLVVVVIALTLLLGPFLFSPGSLNSQAKAAPLGGVASHAGLGNQCGACHTAPWSSQTMADKCIACHEDVAPQISGKTGLHGALLATRSPTCAGCHPDHHGPNGTLTALDRELLSRHAQPFAFKLTGKHATIPCSACHANAKSLQDFQSTPQDCNSCHGKSDPHKGSFGTQCGSCHNTSGWGGANFNHDIFPVNHGTDKQASTCQTCHPSGTTTYTCFGCHQHTQSNVVGQHEGQSAAALADCIKCHAGGKVPD